MLSHPEATFFHSAAWAKVLCKTYRHEPLYLHFSEAGATWPWCRSWRCEVLSPVGAGYVSRLAISALHSCFAKMRGNLC